MTTETSTINDTQSLDRLKLLVRLAVAALAVSVTGGLLLFALEPASGSSAEAGLGIVAAIGGIATGAFIVAAAIYAQVKNLWRLAPIGIRVVLWGFIAVGVALTLWKLISQPFQA